ncbi:metal ABC transporter solute-binding protein, Zn/Mn family [Maridesulfovibrio sp.]|uniref:metal ABC transporter solute-binding protein, Zn/Mn family n=1 Tax=Maridesulfovibrio sp. TaxID=2795000 RepID=UPI002A18D89F|nr:zinc ABC transporter substrate-binding protein [Maridesulfovibrio sp.]
MKVIRIIPIFLVLTVMLAGRGYADPLQITVSIVPQKYFVEKIGADLVQVNVMVRPGSSPATYEPQPRQMAQLSRAEIYYAIGVPFERAWLPRFKGANADLNIVDLSREVVRVPMQDHVHHSGEPKHVPMDKGEHHDNFIADPHIWLSPPLVRVMAMKIRDTLIEKDPVHESLYRNNYIKFAAEIDSLDTELLKLFSDAPRGAGFMVYHPSWGYFARSYGLRQIPIEIEGKEPSPKEMGELIEIARKNSVSAIFIQPQFSRKSAEAIASSIGAAVLVADPLAEDWAENLRNAAAAFHKNAG